MKILCTLMIAAIAIQNAEAQFQAPYKYPVTKKVDHIDTYFGKEVSDPYRWLEDDNSPETKDWVTRKNKVTQDYLANIPFREDVKTRLTKLWNFPKSSTPFRAGENY